MRSLRDALPSFSEAGELTPQQALYCRYYNLDFAEQRPGVSHRHGLVPSGPFRLAVHRWLQSDARSNLLIVHGYYDHSGLFSKLVEYGLSRNCNVVLFDLPGHGLSSGEPAVIDDFADYSAAIHDVLEAMQLPGLPLWVMAQSTGCAALVEYTRHYPWPFAATVLLAPLARPEGWKRGRLAHSVLRYFVAGIDRKFVPNSSDRDFLAFVQRDPLQSQRLPVRWVSALRDWLSRLSLVNLGVGKALIIQGDADQTVDWRYNLDIYQVLFPGSEIQIVPGAGHQLANESTSTREAYLRRVDAWLERWGPRIDLASVTGAHLQSQSERK